MNHGDGSETGGYKPAALEVPPLPEFLLDTQGLEAVLEDASSGLKAEAVIESCDPEAEAEAARLFDRPIAIRETLDDALPRTDGETWSLRITGVERDDSLPDRSTSYAGICTALDKAAQNQAGARAIEVTIESGDTSALLGDYSTLVSEAELASMPQRLRAMVGAVTETLDKVVPRTDGETWAVLVDVQAQFLLDNS